MLASLLLVACGEQPAEPNYLAYVDPLIGSGGHGHVFVGASVPHGMVQLGPNNLTKGWDWCSGYHDSDSTVVGFAHTHLSGTGIADLGDIALMPVTGAVKLQQGSADNLAAGYVSTFAKENERVEPGYYSVLLDKYAITAELTATDRTGWHRYAFPQGAEAAVVVDLNEATKSLMFRQGTLDSYLALLNDSTVVGYRISNEWAQDHRVYFAARFSEKIAQASLYAADELTGQATLRGEDVKGVFAFGNCPELMAKVGLSYTSIDGALRNLEAEAKGWAFDEVKRVAQARWNEALGAVKVEMADEERKKIFYTALYHTQITPSLFMDVDGAYRGADGAIHQAQGFVPYSVFSLWDTYRAVHPWFTLMDTKTADYVETLLRIGEQQGRMPVWHLAGNETDCMTGVHGITVVADAALKGVPGVDAKRVLEAIKNFEAYNFRGLEYVRERGYIPADKEEWSVAKALEYCVSDYAIAQLAKQLGEQELYEKYVKRSKNYQHYFDPTVGFMRGKLADGSWRSSFDPYHSVHLEDDYVEGNAWQYTWMVPHDPEGLIALFGGKEPFLAKFDSLFTVSSELNEGASVDITGMIGQYAHGNEPSHSTLYLYGYAGEPWKTADKVRQVFDQFYDTTPTGLIGNEDCGQMSAWYLFSALGFYPANPVSGEYRFGSPIVDRATLQLANGKEVVVVAHHNSDENRYIQSATWNGVPCQGGITHAQLLQGGVLEFTMGSSY